MYAALGRAAEAIAAAERALEIDPDDPLAMANLGYAHFIAGDYEAAWAVTAELLAGHPESAPGYNTLGQVLEAEGQIAEAIDTYRRAVELDPRYAEALLNLAQAYLRADEVEAAADAIGRALPLRPRSAAAHAIQARIHLREGSWSQAVAGFQRALDLHPGAAGARGELGYAYLMAGDLRRARAFTVEELERDPELEWGWLNLGVIAFREGDLTEAAKFYQRAIDADPAYVDAYRNLGHAKLALGLLDEAEAAYLRVMALGAESGLVRNNLATLYYRRGAFEQAWEEALLALELGIELHSEFARALELATGRRLPHRREDPSPHGAAGGAPEAGAEEPATIRMAIRKKGQTNLVIRVHETSRRAFKGCVLPKRFIRRTVGEAQSIQTRWSTEGAQRDPPSVDGATIGSLI